METTTTATVTMSPQFDMEYLRTLPGKLKALQVTLALLGFITYMIMYLPCAGSWFSTVTIVSFTFSGILLLFYLFHIIEWLKKVNWLLMEMIYCILFSVLYLVGAIILCTCFQHSGWLVLPALLGFLTAVIYGADGYIKYRAWRNGELAQITKIVTTTTVTNSYA